MDMSCNGGDDDDDDNNKEEEDANVCDSFFFFFFFFFRGLEIQQASASIKDSNGRLCCLLGGTLLLVGFEGTPKGNQPIWGSGVLPFCTRQPAWTLLISYTPLSGLWWRGSLALAPRWAILLCPFCTSAPSPWTHELPLF